MKPFVEGSSTLIKVNFGLEGMEKHSMVTNHTGHLSVYLIQINVILLFTANVTLLSGAADS